MPFTSPHHVGAPPVPMPPSLLTGPMPVLGDRREDRRSATVFTIGKLTCNGRSLPCMVRDLSDGGIRIQMTTPPARGDRVVVEMRGLEPRLARTVWVSGREAGLAFDQHCTPADVFAARSNRSGQVARQPRFTLRRAVELMLDGIALPVEVADISVGGARLILPEPIRSGLRGVLALAMGNRQGIAGDIRWSHDDNCGFRFVEPISSVALTLALDASAVR